MQDPKNKADQSTSGPSLSDDSMSATGMFQKDISNKVSESDDPLKQFLPPPVDDSKILSRTKPPFEEPSHDPVKPAAEGGSSNPGEFTRLFQSMEAPQPEQAKSVAAPAPANSPPSDFTRIFIQIPTPVVPPYPEPRPAIEAASISTDGRHSGFNDRSELSRPVTSIDVPAQEKPSPSPLASPFAADEVKPFKNEPGEFTRMMQTVSDAPASQPAAPDVTKVSPPNPVLRGFSTPGQSNSASGDASFTQIFKRVEAAPQSPRVSEQAKGEFTEIFNNSRANDPRKNADADLPLSWNAPRSAPPPPPIENKPSVTRLMRALSDSDDNAWPSQTNPAESSPVRSGSEPGWGQDGGLTNIGRKLSDVSDSSRSIPVAMSDSAPTISSTPPTGPGEFTRIISAESARPPLAPANLPPPGAASPSPAPQWVAPAAPQWPTTPPLPAAPQRPTMAAPSTPVYQVPAIPQVAPAAFAAPTIPAPPPPRSKFQQYLPFLLILNVFVMVVLILLVVFLLRSH